MEVITDERVVDFIKKLPETAQSRCVHTIELLIVLGKRLGLPHSKKIDTNLWELRTKGDLNVRLLYGFIGKNALIVHGFIKKTNKTPKKEMVTASKRLKSLN